MAWNCDVSIEEKVRQDCYNRGYEQGRKNPCDEIVAHMEELKKQIAKEIWDDITSYYFALRVLGNCTVELDKLAEFWHKHGVEVE